MPFVPIALVVALIWKLVDFAKFVRARDVGSALTQLVVWIGGVTFGLLLRSSDFARGVSLGDTGLTLDQVNLSSTILFGFALGSLASATFDTKRAIDNNDTAKTPALFNTAPPKS